MCMKKKCDEFVIAKIKYTQIFVNRATVKKIPLNGILHLYIFKDNF